MNTQVEELLIFIVGVGLGSALTLIGVAIYELSRIQKKIEGFIKRMAK
jgi:flagellar biogenesis protein FliO